MSNQCRIINNHGKDFCKFGKTQFIKYIKHLCIGCKISNNSAALIAQNLKFMTKMEYLNLSCKYKNKNRLQAG